MATAPHLWVDASNCRDGGGITHLVEVVPRLVDLWPGQITVFAGKQERDLLSECTANLIMPEIDDLDAGLTRRLPWQRFGLPRFVSDEKKPGLVFAPGGLLTGQFEEHIATVTMCRNMLPFEWRETLRYGISKMTARLCMLRRGQVASFSNADGLIFLTEYAKTAVTRKLSQHVLNKIIPHGIGPQFLCPPNNEKILQSPRNLLYLSIIDVYKHQNRVVEALALLVERGHKLSLSLIGGEYAPARRRLDRTLKATKMEAHVDLVGKVDHNLLPQMCQAADIFIFASSCENMPNILLEAMASGLPIACSDRGPMPEVAQDSVAYFDPESPVSIADAIEKLIQHSDLRVQYAQKAFDLAKMYSWDRCAQETADFLHHVWAHKVV